MTSFQSAASVTSYASYTGAPSSPPPSGGMTFGEFSQRTGERTEDGELLVVKNSLAVPQTITVDDEKQLALTPNGEFVIDSLQSSNENIALHAMFMHAKSSIIPSPVQPPMPNPSAFANAVTNGGIRANKLTFKWFIIPSDTTGASAPGYTFSVHGKTSVELLVSDKGRQLGKKESASKLPSMYTYKATTVAKKENYASLRNGEHLWNELVTLVLDAFSNETLHSITKYPPTTEIKLASPVKVYTALGEVRIPIETKPKVEAVTSLRFSNYIRLDTRFRADARTPPMLKANVMSKVTTYKMKPIHLIDRRDPTNVQMVSLAEVAAMTHKMPNGQDVSVGSTNTITFEGLAVWSCPYMSCSDGPNVGYDGKPTDNLKMLSFSPNRIIFKSFATPDLYRTVTKSENEAAIQSMSTFDL